MGSGLSTCFKPLPEEENNHHSPPPSDVIFTAEHPLDETLGHSFCYVRFTSPTSSDRFLSPTPSLRDTAFRSISGASVSANASTPLTGDYTSTNVPNGFDCTSSFSALPLQPLPRGTADSSGFFLSGPIERGALSGPLDSSVPFSAPLGSSAYTNKKKRNKSFSGIKKTLSRTRSISEKKQRPWVVPESTAAVADLFKRESEASNVQWALGKAGEDRVHVVVSEEHGWLFVGIYDGFNGPDAPEFLMGHLYHSVFAHLKGLFWDNNEDCNNSNSNAHTSSIISGQGQGNVEEESSNTREIVNDEELPVKRVTFQSEHKEFRRKLWEFLAEDDTEDGLDLSGSDRFAFSVDDAVSVNNAGSAKNRRSLLLSRLKQGLTRTRDGHGRSFFNWRFGVEDKVDKVDDSENRGAGQERDCRSGRRRKTGPVDHDLVLRALSQALEKTENAYLDMTDKVIDRYPELALMGSCLLVVLMRDEDVYVMNLGDSRAIVAQFEHQEGCFDVGLKEGDSGPSIDGIVEESSSPTGEKPSNVSNEAMLQATKLAALQLSTDHSTSIEEEVLRIKSEHPDDNHCIVNDRVKGRLKVTRAFGAGFLKQPKFNDELLEMFRNEFIGNAPYVSCIPSLRHHKLGPRDQFLVLSSDGLYQYFSNQEVVSFVENFMERFPDGDPAQHLIEELLNRAAKKAGMDFHELLDIPQGDRRKYHDDVTVMVISLEGRIWKSSGKYP